MNTPYTLHWRLRECMHAAGIESVAELHRRLKSIDPDALQYAQLARLVDAAPLRLNLHVLALLATILGCTVGDIIEVAADDSSRKAGNDAREPV